MVSVRVVGSADTSKCADCTVSWETYNADQQFSSAVGATERLVLFPT